MQWYATPSNIHGNEYSYLQCKKLCTKWRGTANFCSSVCLQGDVFLAALKRWDHKKGAITDGNFKDGGLGQLQPRWCRKFVDWLADPMTENVTHADVNRKAAELLKRQCITWHIINDRNPFVHPSRSMPPTPDPVFNNIMYSQGRRRRWRC